MNHGPRTFLVAVLACCVAALGGAAQASAACPNADTPPTAENLPEIRAALVCLHNEARAKARVAPLSRDGRLERAASRHATDMVEDGYFGHDTPSGIDPFDRMRRTGYLGRGIVWNAGETIAWGSGAYATPQAVMDAWMGSTSQRLTLLAPDFRDIGIGIALGAPVERAPNASPAVTYTVDYGWRTTAKALRACLRRAEGRRGRQRRVMRAKCHGLNAEPRRALAL
jgi:uncharacterized protein YkwD